MSKKSITCPYCDEPAYLTTSRRVYNGRDFGDIYLCQPCWAWVGVHKGTTQPLGRLANAALREWKKAAHAAFDPLWKVKMERDGCSKTKARKEGYYWLSQQLGIKYADCHIGMFDTELCQRTVEICERYGKARR